MSDAIVIALIAATPGVIVGVATWRQAAGANRAVNHKDPDDIHLVEKVGYLYEKSKADDELRAMGTARQKQIAEIVEGMSADLVILQTSMAHLEGTVEGNGANMLKAMDMATVNHDAIIESTESLRAHSEADMVIFEDLIKRIEDLYRVLGDPDEWRNGDGEQAKTVAQYLRDVKHRLDGQAANMIDQAKMDIITRAIRIITEHERLYPPSDPTATPHDPDDTDGES